MVNVTQDLLIGISSFCGKGVLSDVNLIEVYLSVYTSVYIPLCISIL